MTRDFQDKIKSLMGLHCGIYGINFFNQII